MPDKVKPSEFNPFELCQSLPNNTYAGKVEISIPAQEKIDVNGDGVPDDTFVVADNEFYCPNNTVILSSVPYFQIKHASGKECTATNTAGLTFSRADIVKYRGKEYTVLEIPEKQELLRTKDGKPIVDAVKIVLLDYNGLGEKLHAGVKGADEFVAALRENIIAVKVGDLKEKKTSSEDSKKAVKFVMDNRSIFKALIQVALATSNAKTHTEDEGPKLSLIPDANESSACAFFWAGDKSALTAAGSNILPIDFDIDGDKKNDPVLKMKVIKHSCSSSVPGVAAQKTDSYYSFATLPLKFMKSSGQILTVGDTVKVGKDKYIIIGLNKGANLILDEKDTPKRDRIQLIVLKEFNLKNGKNLAQNIFENTASLPLGVMEKVGATPIAMSNHPLAMALSKPESEEYLTLLRFLTGALNQR